MSTVVKEAKDTRTADRWENGSHHVMWEISSISMELMSQPLVPYSKVHTEKTPHQKG